MPDKVAAPEIDRLIKLLARLPGLGQRSARRAVLFLMKRRDHLLLPLAEAMRAAAEAVRVCSRCGNLDSRDPCGVCADPQRATGVLCIVEEVGDLWALERTAAFSGRYHILGGTLSALDGRGPEQLNVDTLIERVREEAISEVILALSATVDGQTTAHYLSERLADLGVTVTHLAHGVPLGGELDHLDDGTLTAALRARR
jgi:recombination protein RecR